MLHKVFDQNPRIPSVFGTILHYGVAIYLVHKDDSLMTLMTL